MTPTEQYDELSQELSDELWDQSRILKDTRREAEEWYNKVKQLITADRKRVEIEARIDERENMKFFDNGGHGAEIHLPYVEYRYTGDGLKLTWDDRTEELRKQQEGLR